MIILLESSIVFMVFVKHSCFPFSTKLFIPTNSADLSRYCLRGKSTESFTKAGTSVLSELALLAGAATAAGEGEDEGTVVVVVVLVVVGAGAFSGSGSPAVLPAVSPSTTAARVLDGAALSAASAVVGSVVFVVFAGTPT